MLYVSSKPVYQWQLQVSSFECLYNLSPFQFFRFLLSIHEAPQVSMMWVVCYMYGMYASIMMWGGPLLCVLEHSIWDEVGEKCRQLVMAWLGVRFEKNHMSNMIGMTVKLHEMPTAICHSNHIMSINVMAIVC